MDARVVLQTNQVCRNYNDRGSYEESEQTCLKNEYFSKANGLGKGTLLNVN